MAYSSNNTITAADYNSFVSTVNGVIGTGSGSKGYGQSDLSTVSATDQITAAHWTSLLGAVNTAATHQGTSVSIPGGSDTGYPATGDTIHAFDGSQTIGGASYTYDLSTAVTDIDTNYQNVDAAQQTTTASLHTATRTSDWSGAINAEVDITFADANAVRYFFNTGGELHITADQPTTSTDQDTNWNTVFDTAMGTIKMGYTGTTRTGSGGTVSTTIGYYDLTGTYQTIFDGTNIGSGAYSANDVLIQAKTITNGVRIYINLDDQHSPTAPSTVDNVTSGTKVDFAVRKSSTYTIANPSYSDFESFN
jgi:hypothetical protein